MLFLSAGKKIVLCALISLPAFAQVKITSGPAYCCWSVGTINQALTAMGGSGGYTWSIVNGSLPPGLALRTDVPAFFPPGTTAGIIGVATTPGSYSFTLQATSGGQSVTQAATMKISGLLLMEIEFPDAFAGVPIQALQLTPVQNAGPVSFTISNGAIPSGISLSSSGLYSGTPSTAGSYSWTVMYTDGTDTEYRGASMTVYAARITSPGQLPNASTGQPYSYTLAATGGKPPYTFSASALPSGLSLSSAGVISGTVTANFGRTTFSLTAMDSTGISYSKQMVIPVLGGTQFPSVALYGNGTFDDCTIGMSCSKNGYASGGVPPYTWSAKGLPEGMAIRYGSGVTTAYVVPGDFELWGDPTAAGNYSILLTVTDAVGAASTVPFVLRVSPLAFDYNSALTNGSMGTAYSQTFRVLGGSSTYTAALAGTLLPLGLALDAKKLFVSGTPQENGNFVTSLNFSDSAGRSVQQTFYYSISGPGGVAIGTSNNLGVWSVGSSYNVYLYACCASGLNWTLVSGTLPPGLTLSSSGQIGGVLTTLGTYSFMISATDQSNATNAGLREFTLTVSPLMLNGSSSLPFGSVGSAYAQDLTAAGGTGVLTWTVAANNYLPPGLGLSSSGVISGTPTQTGQFQFTLTATDSSGATGSWAFTMAVFPAPTTKYVSASGSDANPGTLAQPYQTIQKCAGSVYGGSACFVRAGTYRESVTPNSGVVIAAFNDEPVTVDGSDPVTGWAAYQGAIYRAAAALASDDANQIFVGHQMMTEARWPNGNDLFHVNWATAQAGTSDTQLVDSQLAAGDWTGAKIHFLSGQDPWSPQTATVKASASGQLTITLDDADYPPYLLPQAGGRYYLYRSLIALDAQGEWFYDTGTSYLYFWAPGGIDPSTLDVRAKRRRWCFDLSGRSNVTIQNIALFACGINMSSASANNMIDGINGLYVSHFTDMPAVSASNPTGYWYTHVTDSGIVLNGSGNVLRNSTLNWSAGNGVSLQGSGNTVTNNLIMNTGYAGHQGGGGISLFGTLHTVRNNTLRTSGRYLITIYSFPVNPDDNDIGYNNLWNAMMLGLDGGAIYSGEANVTGTRIHHNWVHDTNTPIQFPGMYTRNGIYLDEDANGFEVDQNVIWNNLYSNIFLHGSSSGITTPFNNFIHNNSIPDVGPNANIELAAVIPCGTTSVQDNLVLAPVLQVLMTTSCQTSNNSATAPGATEMNGSVQVGCSFAGCASPAPPRISSTTVAASIEVQPIPAAVTAGQPASFAVVGEGSPPLSHQWLRNGAPISGANGASYTTPTASFGDNGAVFTVQVSNALGTVTSEDATLSIDTPPLIAPWITAVEIEDTGAPTIAPNSVVAIKGAGLSPFGDARTWTSSDSVAGTMPNALDGVSVTMNGEPAHVYYISPVRISVLAPPGLAAGPVQVVVSCAGRQSAPYAVQAGPIRSVRRR
jgi:hypothetical protein